MRSMVEGPFERANNYENRSWSMGSAPPTAPPPPQGAGEDDALRRHARVAAIHVSGQHRDKGVDRRNQSGKSRHDGAKNFHT